MSASSKTWVNNQAPSVEDDDLNGFNLENNNLITGSSQALSPADNQQTHKAVAAYAAVGEFFTGGGIADVYTLSVPSPRIAPAALEDGMIFRAIFPADNTGAATVNPFTLAVIDIKLAGGVTDPAAGQIKAGREAILIHRTSPGVHAELIQTGQVTTTVVTVTDASFTPSPGVKSIEITAVGAGGGGGGVDGQGAGTGAGSTGGAGGATATVLTSDIPSSLNITIGAGGTGGAAGNNNGTAGGATTVVSTPAGINLNAGGGAQGDGDLGASGGNTNISSSGGAATGGDINLKGGDGTAGGVDGPTRQSTGLSGGSHFGGNVAQGRDTAGPASTTPGTGGAGSSTIIVATDFAGGDGADGIVIVREFF